MKKKLLGISICILCLTMLTGCGDKKALSSKEFKEITENEELIITDVKNNFEDKEYVTDAAIAASISGWQIEHYVFTSEEEAKKMYKKNKDDFEKNLNKEDKAKETLKNNHSVYIIDNDVTYKYLSQIDNTVLYINTSSSNKESVNEIIKKLGY